MMTPETISVFESTAGLCIRPKDSKLLVRAVQLYRRLQALLRLSLDDHVDLVKAPKGLQEALVRTASLDPEIARPGLDIVALVETLSAMPKNVADIFDRHCPPAPPQA